jgi:hypothetical protein
MSNPHRMIHWIISSATSTAMSRPMSTSRNPDGLTPFWALNDAVVVVRSSRIDPGEVMLWLVNAEVNALASSMIVEQIGRAKFAAISPMTSRGMSSDGPNRDWMVSRPMTMMAAARNAST